MYTALLCALPLLGADCLVAAAAGSYLEFCDVDGWGHNRYVPYVPHEGDLVFFDKPSPLWDWMDWLAGTGSPDHLGIVVRGAHGEPCILEAGPDAKLSVYVQDALPRLQRYHGRIWVRRLRCPLTPEQSAQLTDFALHQLGKQYAIFRLVRQVTPFRARGPVRTKLFGRTFTDRRRWFCSEVVIAAGSIIGLFDPKQMPANAIYARDILDNYKYDLGDRYERAGRWRPTNPKELGIGD